MPATQCLVRHKTNDCSVPVAFGHQDVRIRACVHDVVIGCRGEVIARHPRCWDRDELIFNPIHCLPLLEQKRNASDQAAPLQGRKLSEEAATLRQLMEARPAPAWPTRIRPGPAADRHAAVKQALQMGAIGFDAAKHLLLCHVEHRPPRLDLDCHPHLPKATVETAGPGSPMRLLPGDAEDAA